MQTLLVQSKDFVQTKVGKLVIVLSLSILSIVGRIYMAEIPNVQPSTAIIIIASLTMGMRAGIMVAFATAIGSNMALGHGTWTILQFLSWGTVAIIAGMIRPIYRALSYGVLIGFAALMGYVYGFVISTPVMATGFPAFALYYKMGLLFDTFHAVGNAIIFAAIAKPLFHVIEPQK